MTPFDYCCSRDGHGLSYPGFSTVFLQIFSLDDVRKFVPEKGIEEHFIEPVRKSIDRQIFTLQNGDRNIQRFNLGGFDFSLLLDEPYRTEMSGHVFVEMSMFFEHTVSISYRFVFDGDICRFSTKEVTTDHIIALLSTHMSAEHWSRDEGCDETDIDLKVAGFRVWNHNLDGNGVWSSSSFGEEILSGNGRVFDQISGRYKLYIVEHCTDFKETADQEERMLYKARTKRKVIPAYYKDYHYAMVDIWENVKHPVEDAGKIVDLFSDGREERLSEADIVSHIRDFHKPEMIGLMSMYPGEWPYRDPEAYDEVCGENIAIDTDDLVLVNTNICVVIGTYGRRGKNCPGVDWEEHLQERKDYHVSWPEYLLILEMVLAKKHIVGYANDKLIEATLDIKDKSSNDLIAHNASLSMRLSRMVLQLDVVKYSKFVSHKVMFDRTTRRLDLEHDLDKLMSMMELVDNSLHNLSDYKSMKSDFILNFILALISVASTFELFFQNSEMPFMTYFGIENNRFAAIFVWVVAAVTFFGILLVIVNVVRNLYSKAKNFI